MSLTQLGAGRLGQADYLQKVRNIAGASLIGYWPMGEAAGTTSLDYSGQGNNGTYTTVVLAQPGIGDGRTAALFDGTASFNNIFSTALAADFNGAAGTLLIWARMAGSSVWTDAAFRVMARLQADASNFVWIYKSATNNAVVFEYAAGGVGDSVSLTSWSPLTWEAYGLTWDTAADELRAYRRGTQTGATQGTLGTWSGSLTNGSTLIGAQDTVPIRVHSGRLQHAVLMNRAATATEIAAMSVLDG